MNDDLQNLEQIEETAEQWTDKHWQILEAAVKVFSEKGFNASRTSEVAKEAGVSEGTVFNYFKTKKDLLKGMLIPLLLRFFRPWLLRGVEKIFNNRQGRPVEDVMTDLVRDRVHLAQANLPLIKAIASEAPFQPELFAPVREQILPQILEVATRFFQEEMEKGTFRTIDPLLAFRGLLSMLAGYVIMRNIAPEEFQLQEEEVEIRRLVDLYLHGLLPREES
ncbi:TetR/AcrR family transcriptional regulator [Tumebacillus amylolyticus]|uniref:TetR/AcrR family transcriptional regulator n=1 Tax=Tumebacillus amylolyticus TaxID=2801339 RepID=UPI001F245E50|nr:TetR/AcrR family transcriptional regulator [Tumebacillus amylolyticus]